MNKKHVFKMVPGKYLGLEGGMTWYSGKNICLNSSFSSRDNANFSKPYKISKLAFIPLNDESEEVLAPNVYLCQFLDRAYICLNELGHNLRPSTSYHKDSTDNSFIYLNDHLVNLVTDVNNYGSRYSKGEFLAQFVGYQYVTQDESGKYYFSDGEGNIIDSPYNKALEENIVPCREKEIVNNAFRVIPEHLLKKFNKDEQVVSDEDIDIDGDGWHTLYFQGIDTELMMMYKYIQSECGI